MKFRIDKRYGFYTVLLLAALLAMAYFVNNDEFNKNIGSVALVIFLYCLVMTFLDANKKAVVITVSILALLFGVSLSFGWLESLGWQNSRIFTHMLGTDFEFNNVWSYLVGGALVYMLEFYDNDTRPKKKKFLGF